MPRVAIVDDEMAKKLFPNTDAIGQHIRYTQPPKDGSPNDMEVVGVVGSHRHDVQTDTLNRRLFVPLAQGYSGNVYLHVRFATKDRSALIGLIPTLRQTLRDIDPDLPILSIAPFSDLLEKSVGLWVVRLGAALFGVFGGIALLLAVVGVYGVKAYAVACRTREIGIRMALGAEPGAVLRLILRESLVMALSGVALGFLLALGIGRALSSMLYQVSPVDPVAFTLAPAVLIATALFACWLPARRAAKVDPMVALRAE
jgi:ABC-type antimicrobial peptide transport system permease subunit